MDPPPLGRATIHHHRLQFEESLRSKTQSHPDPPHPPKYYTILTDSPKATGPYYSSPTGFDSLYPLSTSNDAADDDDGDISSVSTRARVTCQCNKATDKRSKDQTSTSPRILTHTAQPPDRKSTRLN